MIQKNCRKRTQSPQLWPTVQCQGKCQASQRPAGRNSQGRITSFHGGGGIMRLHRIIDLKRDVSAELLKGFQPCKYEISIHTIVCFFKNTSYNYRRE
uniref:Large ribosomal subunit protein uL2 RNA-binding domain-containing protein n=1 Tax=Kalanchoe fedtschenkoi TaxID=63787 RepID=A0A7N0UUW0_KALFE